MWIRSAFWVGRPKPGQEQRFEVEIKAMVPAMRALPGVRDVSALWPRHREDDPPDLACQFVVEFANHADLERMKASPERAALRTRVASLREMFDGRMSHIEFEATSAD